MSPYPSVLGGLGASVGVPAVLRIRLSPPPGRLVVGPHMGAALSRARAIPGSVPPPAPALAPVLWVTLVPMRGWSHRVTGTAPPRQPAAPLCAADPVHPCSARAASRRRARLPGAPPLPSPMQGGRALVDGLRAGHQALRFTKVVRQHVEGPAGCVHDGRRHPRARAPAPCSTSHRSPVCASRSGGAI
jgi:hypothetical protein